MTGWALSVGYHPAAGVPCRSTRRASMERGQAGNNLATPCRVVARQAGELVAYHRELSTRSNPCTSRMAICGEGMTISDRSVAKGMKARPYASAAGSLAIPASASPAAMAEATCK